METEATEDLTRLTVNITPKAVAALASAADLHGCSRTDLVSRALVVYDNLMRLEPGHSAVIDGTRRFTRTDVVGVEVDVDGSGRPFGTLR